MAHFDVVVIGGGPAGMMAAGRAAERGKKVCIIEKNEKLGKKLLITGGGRCNLTNAEFDTRTLLARYKDAEPYLYSTFSQWNVENTLKFFESRGMPTKTEAEKRVFPVSNTAQSVWDVLVDYCKKGSVDVLLSTEVTKITSENGKITGIHTKKKKEIITADSYILAAGGMSHPETGSTGECFSWLTALGHTIITPTPSLVPLKSHDLWIRELQGLTLPDIKLTLYQSGMKESSQRGKILFAHFGLTGPTILNMSKEVQELLHHGPVHIGIDLFPDHDHGELNAFLQKTFTEHSNKHFKNCLAEIISARFVSRILHLTHIDPLTRCHSVSREARLLLISTLKDIRIEIHGLLGTEKAIITSGGVALDEIDWKTMRSKKISNLFLIGDTLNIDRPSGGFSLQLCWSTGFVAGNSA